MLYVTYSKPNLLLLCTTNHTFEFSKQNEKNQFETKSISMATTRLLWLSKYTNLTSFVPTVYKYKYIMYTVTVDSTQSDIITNS